MERLPVTPAALHHAILRHVLDRGYAPDRLTLAARFDVDAETVTQALYALQAEHGVVLHPHTPEVWVIHPFSTAPALFAVRRGDRLWWGNCAWCSLGIAALVGGDGVTIDTTYGAEGRHVTLHLDGGQVRERLWVHFPVPMARAWDNVIYTCSTMLVFESETAIDAWSQRHAIPRGSAQPVQRVYEFAKTWYRRHLDSDWRKWTAQEASEIFERFGFEGPVWQLPRTTGRF